MLIHAIRRSAGILCTTPSKLSMIFTPRGWYQFGVLKNELIGQKRAAAAHEARMATQRAEFSSNAWRHEGALSQRQYESYDKYLDHQKAKLASLGGFRIEEFRDLTPHGSEWWHQAELIKI